MSKKLVLLIVAIIILSACLFVAGCSITGKVVQQLDYNVEAQIEKDYSKMVDALDKEDPTLCYYILTQHIREDCFIRLAKNTGDRSVCNNLLSPHPRDSCLAQFD